MQDRLTQLAIMQRKSQEDLAAQVAKTLVDNRRLWKNARIYKVRNFIDRPVSRRRYTRTITGTEVIHNLYVSAVGTFFVKDPDLFGTFYEHIELSDLTDETLEEFIRLYEGT
ncbi:MAG: hypothetical protein L0H36_01035 [bacterium]|nr:hypothetical protein [bacterium]MDN5835202.1 hypothetical protein [bacterium]